ncbi:UNVERIFIED_CONTAM: hypothetical protein Sangu_2027500, partial [Sesamum angustifolium]
FSVIKVLITCPDRDLGPFHWAALHMFRCKRLLENVEDTFMDVVVWVSALFPSYLFLTTNFTRLLLNFPRIITLPLRVEPNLKSGIRQQDLLKRVLEVKPKRPRVASPSNVDPSSTTLSGQTTHQAMNDGEKEKSQSSSRFSKVGDGAKLDNPVKSLLAAYESSDDEA